MTNTESRELAVIVVSHNTREQTEHCLQHLLKYTDVPCRIWVVDNASTDGSAAMLEHLQRQHPGKLHVVYSSDNLGYGGGVQLAYRDLPEDCHVAYVNSDCYVGPGWASRLVHHLNDGNRIGAVAPLGCVIGGWQDYGMRYRNLGIDGPPSWASAWLSELRRINEDLKSAEPRGETAKVLMGCVLVVHALAHQHVGGLDPLLCFGADDFDYALRLRLAGWRLVVALDCFVLHEGHATFRKMPATDMSTTLSWQTFNHKWAHWFDELSWDELFVTDDRTDWPPYVHEQFSDGK